MPTRHLFLPIFLFPICLLFMTCAVRAAGAGPARAEAEKTSESQSDKVVIPRITEEITVTATVEPATTLSTGANLDREDLVNLAQRTLADALPFVAGSLVTTGQKNETGIRLRGMDGKRIALLVDGVPVHEPYFNAFNLATFPIEAIQNVQVAKGASSVLYGPNTMGGVIDVTTRRPEQGFVNFSGSGGSFGSSLLSATAALAGARASFLGSGSWDRSDGWSYRDANGDRVNRVNSRHDRRQALLKAYWQPDDTTEIMISYNRFEAVYDIPAATAHTTARHWTFPEWTRDLYSAGATFSPVNNVILKARAYHLRHFNVLEAYRDVAMTNQQWVSTYDNLSSGVSLTGAGLWSNAQETRFSLSYRDDRVRQQGSIGADWEFYGHRTLSTGLEQHVRLTSQWRLVGGFSVDHLRKDVGNAKTSFNPVGGITFDINEEWSVYASASRRSRFPTMRSLYSTTAGNPDLRDELALNVETGITWRGWGTWQAAVFNNQIKDLIESVRLPSGYNTSLNIGRARLTGAELNFEHTIGPVEARVGGTLLDAENRDTGERLVFCPKGILSVSLLIRPAPRWTAHLWGMATSSAESVVSNNRLTIPGYGLLNAEVRYDWRDFALFVRAENLLDKSYVTEPGFPMAARMITGGLRWTFNRERM